jgi:hypothetical protein
LEQRESYFKVKKILWLSADNPVGYNNQVTKINDEFYYTRQHHDSIQTDIYSFDLENQLKYPVTRTKESEYSPKPAPDGKSFTTVRVESDGKTQLIWRYPIDRKGNGEKVKLPYDNIGYYQWQDKNKLALFLVEEIPTLIYYNLESGKEETISRNVDRCFKWIDKNTLYYIDIFSEEFRYIKHFNPSNPEKDNIIARIPNTVRDFTVLPYGTLVIGNGSRLLTYQNEIDVEWKPMVDLKEFGLENITRILTLDENTFIIVDDKDQGS